MVEQAEKLGQKEKTEIQYRIMEFLQNDGVVQVDEVRDFQQLLAQRLKDAGMPEENIDAAQIANQESILDLAVMAGILTPSQLGRAIQKGKDKSQYETQQNYYRTLPRQQPRRRPVVGEPEDGKIRHRYRSGVGMYKETWSAAEGKWVEGPVFKTIQQSRAEVAEMQKQWEAQCLAEAKEYQGMFKHEMAWRRDPIMYETQKRREELRRELADMPPDPTFAAVERSYDRTMGQLREQMQSSKRAQEQTAQLLKPHPFSEKLLSMTAQKRADVLKDQDSRERATLIELLKEEGVAIDDESTLSIVERPGQDQNATGVDMDVKDASGGKIAFVRLDRNMTPAIAAKKRANGQERSAAKPQGFAALIEALMRLFGRKEKKE